MKNDNEARPLTDDEAELILGEWPTAQVDEAVTWAGPEVQLDLHDHKGPLSCATATRAVEVEVGLRCLHIFLDEARLDPIVAVYEV